MQNKPAGDPFDDIRGLIPIMPDFSRQTAELANEREAQLTKPAGALGRLEELTRWLAGWQNKAMPTMARPTVAIFAGNHGVLAQGVSAYPMAVTRQMLENFGKGGAAINQICGTYGLGLKVFELALDLPTKDITQEPAMSAPECAATMAFGMEAIAGADVLGLGEMGIGNSTAAAAIYLALYGGTARDWIGRGAGVDDAGLARKIDAVERAVARNAAYLDDPLEILRALGGREIAAIAGAILAARMERVPVVLDGYIVCAAAAILHRLAPMSIDHCIAAHLSAEGAHSEVLARLGKKPLLDLGLRLGEGSGAALAMGLMQAAVNCHKDMATFASAGVAPRTSSDQTQS